MRARIEDIDSRHEAHVYEEDMDELLKVLEYCKYMRDTRQWGPPDMRNYGVIPNFFIQQYMHDNGISYAEYIRNPDHGKRMLNDPALSLFRIYPGRA